MMIKGGHMGKLLRVDLSSGSVKAVPLPPDDTLRKFVGCIGLGLHILAQEASVETKALDPENPLIFMTGPLTGTACPSSSNWSVISLHLVIPYYPLVSHAHGFWGARLKFAGYDGVVVKGVSEKPVYLWVDDDHLELRDASHLCGQGTFETQRLIRKEHNDSEKITIAAIGPFGEKGLMGASIRSPPFGCNKGGNGAIMGSKNLKAIAVRGTKTVPIAEQELFAENAERWHQVTREVGKKMASWGGALEMCGIYIEGWGRIGMIPAFNFRDAEWGVKWGENYGKDVAKWVVKPVESHNCDIRCHTEVEVTTGPYAGFKTKGFIGEVIEGGATNIGVSEPGTCIAMCHFWDDLGADPSEAGHVIAAAYEMYERGMLDEKDTGGLKLTWGNDEAMREIVMQMISGEGFGGKFAKTHNLKEAARILVEIGGEKARKALEKEGLKPEDLVMHVKEAGVNDHFIISWGLSIHFGNIVSLAGPTWQVESAELIPEPDVGYPYATHQYYDKAEGKGEELFRVQAKKMWHDVNGCCHFAQWGVKDSLNVYTTKAIVHGVGWKDFTPDEALLVGERVMHLQRLMALKRGYKKEYEFDVAPRLLSPIEKPGPIGIAFGPPKPDLALGPYFSKMLDDYFEACGWDVKTGVPMLETLRRVGLEDYVVFPH